MSCMMQHFWIFNYVQSVNVPESSMVIKYDFVLWISIISSDYVSLCFKTLSFLSPEVKF